jgi:hypothetical protein
MHGPACAGSQRGTGAAGTSGCGRARALEDRPASGVCGAGSGGVGWTRAGLRHDHATGRRRLGRRSSSGRLGFRSGRCSGCRGCWGQCGWRCGGCGDRGCCCSGYGRRCGSCRNGRWLDDDRDRRRRRGYCGRSRCRTDDYRAWGCCGAGDGRAHRTGGRGRRGCRSCVDDGRGGAGLRHNPARRGRLVPGRWVSRRRWRGRCCGCGRLSRSSGRRGARRSRGRSRGCCGGRCGDGGPGDGRSGRPGLRGGFGLLALKDGLQGVPGLGHVREVEGRLGVSGRSGGCGRTGAASQIAAHLFGFVLLDGARVRLLLGDADRCQSIKNGLTLDLQFPCKIVDANFAHSILL